MHIAWELQEGASRLYKALPYCAPDLDLQVEGRGSFPNYSPTENPRLEDLVPVA
ncbi:hypothetical protein Pure05_42330 [Paenarthrobacter ureafaciens]|nr:hypothetical protein Pure01_42350 [Paenarthrobacter ureafaciens]GLU66000.1 hypothetical protein Pure02_42500 [Paenarthrobacter ureafaciens]GLU74537.1 hypothetical protein Pure04_42520 [Paenarthrobacter ureafaciens]GLU78793.1 hypothetical protein Pure05_42330 [Paenarthrobacter ureafaciens]